MTTAKDPEQRSKGANYRIALIAVAALLTGAVAGRLAVPATVTHLAPESVEAFGPWELDRTLGSKRSSSVTRAASALTSIWAMSSDQALYLLANRDSTGEELTAHCTYRVSGGPFQTRWWSITAYQDDRMVPNDLQRYSYSQTSVRSSDDGGWNFLLSPTSTDSQWLPLDRERGDVELALRLYDPDDGLRENLTTDQLPRIDRVSCL